MRRPVILCVDDEEIILQGLKAQLRRHFQNDYDIQIVLSAIEALKIIEDLIVDNVELPVVISDHIMPDMRGDDFLARVHALLPQTLKIMLTGQADVVAVGNAVNQARLYRFIPKPWEEMDLTMTVKEALQTHSQQKQIDKQHETLQHVNNELRKLTAANSRFVPYEFLQTLGYESIVEVKVGDQIEGEMTVSFSDIRAYTSLAEKMTPKETFDFINGYLSRVGPCIRRNNGFVNQYYGDGVMAIYPRQAEEAVLAAIQMHKRVAEYNTDRLKKQRVPIQIGVGLHTGPLMLGIIGDEERMDTGVVSDTVNTAARMEGLTKIFGLGIVVSQNTVAHLKQPDQFHFRFLGKVLVHGRREVTTIYELFDGDREAVIMQKLETLKDFEEGIRCYYAREFADAIVFFNNVLKLNPEDKATRYYLEKAAKYVVENVPPDWAGIEQMIFK